MKHYLGIELGSTRIKAVAIDERHIPVSSGDYTWKSTYENGIWTYGLHEVWKGLKAALSGVENPRSCQGARPAFLAFRTERKVVTTMIPMRSRYQHKKPLPMVIRKIFSGKGNNACPSCVMKG